MRGVEAERAEELKVITEELADSMIKIMMEHAQGMLVSSIHPSFHASDFYSGLDRLNYNSIC